MNALANAINEIGRGLQDRGHLGAAAAAYAAALRIAPSWESPWFNRGLIAKFRREWQDCYRFNLKATELDPDFKSAWWNLGIAATAIGDWVMARRAWWRYGISVPLGEGPPDMALGSVPIRLDPGGRGEVVWCDRLDPARTRIRNIPFPETGRAFRDVLLNDGEPKGFRENNGTEVPVFNELALLVPSAFNTYAVTVLAPDEPACQALCDLAHEKDCGAEDWSTVRTLCTACSEGHPGAHDHEHDAACQWSTERAFALACPSDDLVDEILDAWSSSDAARSVQSIECAFTRT